MPLKPGHAEDNIVGSSGDVEAEKLGRAAGMNEEGVIMGDCIGGRFPIGEDEGYRVTLWETWKVVRLRQLVINKTTLSSTV